MRILLADQHPPALWALKTTLDEGIDFEVTGEVRDADSLLALAEENPPELALIDFGLPGRPIEDLITELHAFEPRPIVIVMSSKSENSRMALKAGADAFISKSDQPEWLLETLQRFKSYPSNKKQNPKK